MPQEKVDTIVVVVEVSSTLWLFGWNDGRDDNDDDAVERAAL